MTVVGALLRALQLRDPMTARHSVRVAAWARVLARAAGISEPEQELAHTAGLLHDIGKLNFPDRILKRDVRLTDSDWITVRRHPAQGGGVITGIGGLERVREIVVAHHERIDGAGYPLGLAGDRIPAVARIVAVADVYDAMTERDSYREPVSRHEAIAELKRVAGSQLDARYVDLFVDALERGERIESRREPETTPKKETRFGWDCWTAKPRSSPAPRAA